jgi:hypothetical protein
MFWRLVWYRDRQLPRTHHDAGSWGIDSVAYLLWRVSRSQNFQSRWRRRTHFIVYSSTSDLFRLKLGFMALTDLNRMVCPHQWLTDFGARSKRHVAFGNSSDCVICRFEICCQPCGMCIWHARIRQLLDLRMWAAKENVTAKTLWMCTIYGMFFTHASNSLREGRYIGR